MPDDRQLPRDDRSLEERGAALLAPSRRGPQTIPRVVSLLVLIAVLLLTAVLFFRVMALFVVPLFLAGVLVVVFEPLFTWVCGKLPGRPGLASLATTALIWLVVLVPFGLAGWKAIVETARVAEVMTTEVEHIIDVLEERENDEITPQERTRAERIQLWYRRLSGRELDPAEYADVRSRVTGAAARRVLPAGVTGVQSIATVAIGLVVMTVAVYYFFADGPAMVRTLMHLSPLDDAYEAELLDRFSDVSRAVVLATVLSAIAQGVLAGAGYWFALSSDAPVFLLTVATALLAMVPFVGAAAVWIPVSAWLVFLQGEVFAGAALALYGALVVSTVDNIIKPVVLHGQSKLHPLLALLSVLGGVMVLGPIGVLVGPMLVTFLQALLIMLRRELDSIEEEAGRIDAENEAARAAATPPTPASAEKPRDENADEQDQPDDSVRSGDGGDESL